MEKLPPKDSRLRPDQRHLEKGEYEKANELKQRNCILHLFDYAVTEDSGKWVEATSMQGVIGKHEMRRGLKELEPHFFLAPEIVSLGNERKQEETLARRCFPRRAVSIPGVGGFLSLLSRLPFALLDGVLSSRRDARWFWILSEVPGFALTAAERNNRRVVPFDVHLLVDLEARPVTGACHSDLKGVGRTGVFRLDACSPDKLLSCVLSSFQWLGAPILACWCPYGEAVCSGSQRQCVESYEGLSFGQRKSLEACKVTHRSSSFAVPQRVSHPVELLLLLCYGLVGLLMNPKPQPDFSIRCKLPFLSHKTD
ncbi:hypothetical protein Bca4012_019851 [Brassica carinata]